MLARGLDPGEPERRFPDACLALEHECRRPCSRAFENGGQGTKLLVPAEDLVARHLATIVTPRGAEISQTPASSNVRGRHASDLPGCVATGASLEEVERDVRVQARVRSRAATLLLNAYAADAGLAGVCRCGWRRTDKSSGSRPGARSAAGLPLENGASRTRTGDLLVRSRSSRATGTARNRIVPPKQRLCATSRYARIRAGKT
jgi:hypothetical protein